MTILVIYKKVKNYWLGLSRRQLSPEYQFFHIVRKCTTICLSVHCIQSFPLSSLFVSVQVHDLLKRNWLRVKVVCIIFFSQHLLPFISAVVVRCSSCQRIPPLWCYSQLRAQSRPPHDLFLHPCVYTVN